MERRLERVDEVYKRGLRHLQLLHDQGDKIEPLGGIKRLVDAIGIDHVGTGSDTDILSSRSGQSTNAAWPGQSGGFFRAAVAEMLRQGFTPDDIGKIGGGNFCRVFDKVTTGHA